MPFIRPAVQASQPIIPSWASGLSIGQWYEIPSTNLSSVDPSPAVTGNTSNKVDGWTSMTVDEDNSILYAAAGGGHTDYSGNEVDKLALNVSSPAWQQVKSPTPTAQLLDAEYYSDNRPASRHHYFGCDWNKIDNRLMLAGGARWFSPAVTDRLDAFNLGSSDWELGGLSSIPFTQEKRPVCRDPRNDNLYVFGDAVVYKWTRSSNTWNSVTPSGYTGGFFDNGAAWDSTRNKIHLMVGSGTAYDFAPDSGTWSTRTLTGTSITPGSGTGLVYIPTLDVFLHRYGDAGGGGVEQINASTFVVSSFSTNGGASITAPFRPIYKKFLYVPTLKGCVLITQHTGNVWFLRVH